MAKFLQALALVSVIPLSIPLGASAHMEMRWPYAFRSKYDPTVTDPDYDNDFPLNADGSNYPCHAYQNLSSSQISKATYNPGETYNLTLAGTAMHDGGSCQISLSYDNGQSFRVIESLIGGCSLQYNWNFTVPDNAPATDGAILAWTWFNIVGNREMYMSCARVSITGQPVQRFRRYQSKRQNPLDELPENFACNIGNGCTTIEDRQVVFPNPGEFIEYHSNAIVPSPGPGFTLSATPTGNAFSTIAPTTTVTTIALYPYPNGTATGYPGPTGTGSPSNITTTAASSSTYFNSTVTLLTVTSRTTFVTTYLASSTATTTGGFFYPQNGTNTSTSMMTMSTATSAPSFSNATTTTSSTNQTMVVSTITSATVETITSSVASTTTASTATTVTSSVTPTATVLPGDCTLGTFTCNSTTTFSQCVSDSAGSGTYVFLGSVAAGTQCVNGTIESSNDGPCTPSGSLQCDGEFAFYLCDQGGLIDMGPVASGTACRNGTIVLE